MDIGIKPMYSPMPHLVGQALTPKPHRGQLPDPWRLGLTQPGDVLVLIAWLHGRLWSRRNGLQGSGIQGAGRDCHDGTWRDIAEVSALNLPLFARGVSPFSPMKSDVGEINVPISCGHVIVEPGDVIIGDAQGIVVIPRREAKNVPIHLKVTTSESKRERLPGSTRITSMPVRVRSSTSQRANSVGSPPTSVGQRSETIAETTGNFIARDDPYCPRCARQQHVAGMEWHHVAMEADEFCRAEDHVCNGVRSVTVPLCTVLTVNSLRSPYAASTSSIVMRTGPMERNVG